MNNNYNNRVIKAREQPVQPVQSDLFFSTLSTPKLTAAEYQNTKAGIRFYSTKCWVLPEPLISQYFSQYRLIYWSGKYLLKQLSDHQGYIIRVNPLTSARERYKVEYFRSLNRGRIMANQDAQFALSLRIPAAEWNLPAIALISGANHHV